MYDITEIQIVPIIPRDGIVAFASVIFEDAFYLGSIAIITRPHGGYRLSYPTRKLVGTNVRVFYPINKEVAALIEQAVIEKYESVVKERPASAKRSVDGE
jgi:DNA-binding cell septation regulator SpoVG